MKIRKISLNKVVTNHNTVNVPVRRPHDHKYVNQESFRRFYVYVIKRLCDWDAERVYKERSVLSIGSSAESQYESKGKVRTLVRLICGSQHTADRPFGVALVSRLRNILQDEMFETCFCKVWEHWGSNIGACEA